MHYFICKGCNYLSKQKIDMKRHLNKKISCIHSNSNINKIELMKNSHMQHNI